MTILHLHYNILARIPGRRNRHALGECPLDVAMCCVVVTPCRAMCVGYVVYRKAAVSNLRPARHKRPASHKRPAISFYAALALLLFILEMWSGADIKIVVSNVKNRLFYTHGQKT